ncbi:MAG TPA: LPS export ABC transporter periplasmic protein LptC [Alphaproteobacteria bacterium]
MNPYTRYVRVLRLVLPVLASVSLLVLLIWPWWHERQQLSVKKVAPPVSTAQTPKSAAPLQVLKPEYQGMDKSGRMYRITAERVEQTLDPKAPLLLIAPQASLNMSKNAEEIAAPSDANPPLTLRATNGLYDMQAQTIDLKGKVVLDYAGYQLTAEDLAVDMVAGAATTTTPVTGQGPRGTLSGQMLSIADKGSIIVLKGPSRLVLMPENTADKP